MKGILAFLLCISVSTVFAQFTITYYFNDDFVLINDLNHYQYKATVETETKKLKGNVKIRVELKDGTLLHKYEYSDLENGLKIDTTLIFNEDGSIYSITPYNSKGEIVSEMIFHKNGKLFQEIYYKNKVKNGASKTYFVDGKLQSLNHFQNGLLIDTSYYYYVSGLLQKKNYYSNGSLNKTYTYNKTGSLTLEYNFNAAGDTISIIEHFKVNDNETSSETSIFTEELPIFRGGVTALYKYLSNNISYPSGARDNGIQGKVRVKFLVSENGEIQSIQTIDPIYPLIDFEAMRVINNMPDWTPGKQNGKNVEVWYTLPVSFLLN